MRVAPVVLFLLVAPPGCSSGSNTADSGPVDAGGPDAGLAQDAGPFDAGPSLVCPGATMCKTVADCPAPDTACVVASCDLGCCVTVNVDAGTACSGDGGVLCDGNGNCVACLTASDCAAASCNGSTFTPAATCSASNTCVAGTPQTCPMECDPDGGCVECNTNADCSGASCDGGVFTPAGMCSNHACVAGTPQTCPMDCSPDAGCVQ